MDSEKDNPTTALLVDVLDQARELARTIEGPSFPGRQHKLKRMVRDLRATAEACYLAQAGNDDE